MSTASPAGTTSAPAKNGTTTANKPGPAKTRVPRTEQKKLFDALDNILKKATPDDRKAVLRSITALYGAD